MPKEGSIEFQGVVLELLPLTLGGLYSAPGKIQEFSTSSIQHVPILVPTVVLAVKQSQYYLPCELKDVLKQRYSDNLHQPYGGSDPELCAEQETDLFGLGERKRYMCDSDFRFWKLCGVMRSTSSITPTMPMTGVG